jgi:hypothetical protein
MKTRVGILAMSLLGIASLTGAKDPVRSGPKVGAVPGPYTFCVSTGPNRGQDTCFICDTAERPAVVVFARNTSDGLGKLAGKLDRALAEHKAAGLRSWITFIGKDHENFDQHLLDWSKQHALKSLPIGTLKEEDGPPTYQVARAADITVVLFVRKKVQATFGFRGSELTDAAVQRVLDAVPPLLAKKR